jgi:hypothetical protein
MSAIVDDGDTHGPLLALGVGFCRRSDTLDVGKFEYGFGFHVDPL